MTSASTTNPVDMAASSFSYAQAAKGNGTPTSSQAPETASNPPQESDIASKSSPCDEATAPEHQRRQQQENGSEVTAVLKTKQEPNGFAPSEHSQRAEQALTVAPSEPAVDEDTGRLNRPWRRADRDTTRSSSAATRSVDDNESKKPRRNKKTRSSDKPANDDAAATDKAAEPEPAPKVELSEAPIPSVNIWQQRKQAHQAKAVPSSTTSAAQNGHQAIPTATEESKAATTTTSVPVHETASVATTPDSRTSRAEGAATGRKPAETSRSDRNGSRGTRLGAKEAKDGKSAIPPPVNDSASWPTPETVIKEDKQKTSEKVERGEKHGNDENAPPSKPRQKEKWMAYDFVPTVNFETQLPQMRGSKARGGSKSGGGRAASGSQAGDRSSAVQSSAKPSEPRERAKDDSNATDRNASAPSSGKHTPAEPGVREQRKPPTQAPSAEKAKEAAPAPPSESNPPRETRSERGRGGFRGRGGHHNNVVPHIQQRNAFPGGAGIPSAAPMSARSQSLYGPNTRQGGNHGQMFMPPTQREVRGGRGGSVPNAHRMSLPNGPMRPPPVQTQFNGYEYPLPPMSAMPYQAPYWDGMLVSMLKGQIEYYFSIDNLCKDMYLRKRMDSKGFVPLHFIIGFKRMRELTQDIALVRAVCMDSNEIDFVVGEDDCERLRSRFNWQMFVLPMVDRDELARNDGPMHLVYRNRPHVEPMGSQFPPQQMPYGMVSPPPYPTPPEPGFAPYVEEPKMAAGLVNGSGNDHGSARQLSADVPDFSPSGSLPPGGRASITPQEAGKKSYEKQASDSAGVDQGSAANHSEKGINGVTNGINGHHDDAPTA